MNSIGILHTGREYYYVKLGKDDYYTNEKDPQGVFYGRGANRLGLDGQEIEHNDLRLKKLFQGINPTNGDTLRKGAYTVKEYKQYVYTNPESGKKQIFKSKAQIPDELKAAVTTEKKLQKGVIGYDNVFSAPKDVSVLWSQADNELRNTIHSLHKEAVKESISYLEDVCYTRRGTNGVKHEQADGIFATFHHTTSRALDPQLHSHVVIINSGFTKNGKTGALDGKRILNARYTAGMIYQNHLRGALEKQLGIVTYDRPFSSDKGTSFGIEGLSAEAKWHFSKRALAIEKRITPTMTGNEIRAEVLKSRNPKQHNIDHGKLFMQWKVAGIKHGINVNKILNRQAYNSTVHPEKFFREVSTRLAFKEGETTSRLKNDEERYLSKNQILNALLSASRGKLSTENVLILRDQYLKEYTEKKFVENSRTVEFYNKKQILETKEITSQELYYSLNETGKHHIDYKDRWEKAHAVVKKVVEWHKDIRSHVKQREYEQATRRFNFKSKILYATGKISRKQYLQFTQGKGLPKNHFMIRTYQVVGLISKNQADYLIAKPELEKKFAEVAAWKQQQQDYKAWAKDKSEFDKVYRAGTEAKAKREERESKQKVQYQPTQKQEQNRTEKRRGRSL
jgi:conjugative relaxase-like TrwC/TraI family protein